MPGLIVEKKQPHAGSEPVAGDDFQVCPVKTGYVRREAAGSAYGAGRSTNEALAKVMSVSSHPAKTDSDSVLHTAGCAPSPPGAHLRAVWLDAGAAVLDAKARIVSVNAPLAIWLGVAPGELSGQSLPVLIGQRFPEWEEPLKEFFDRKLAFDRLELAGRSNRERQQLAVESCLYGDVRFVCLASVLPSMRDLEESFPEESWGRVAGQAAFNRLIRAEAQLDNLVHRWPGIVFSQRPDFSFSFVSPRIEEFTGISPQEWCRGTRYFWQVVHEADAEGLRKRLEQTSDSPEGTTSTFRIRHSQTGRVSYLWEHRQAVRSNRLLLGYEGIWLDITRQTIAERRLLNMSWKENLGMLTMGLAHDFCNIMAGIVALSETFGDGSCEKESLQNGLRLIRSTAGQASELAHRIRQLHQGVPGEKNYHDLNEIVSAMIGVLQKVLPRRVRVLASLEPGRLPIYGDAVELRQVIVNLALNAVDAIPNVGSLEFRTSRHEKPPAERPVEGEMPRPPMVCLSVVDSGAGIPENYVHSIFDPFFTTKPLGKGSGLGLYNTRLFAQNHAAAISVESREQAGTTFRLWFPQADFSEGQEESQPAAQRPRDTLLVVGQPSEARDRTVETLRANAFYVVAAGSKTDALEALHSSDYSFGGVVLLCQRARTEELSLFHRISAERLPVRLFVGLLACNPDEIDTALLERADAVLPQDLAAPEMVSRVKAVLEQS